MLQTGQIIPPFEISNDSPVKVKVQDNYKVDNNDTKWSQIQSILTEVKADTSGKAVH